MLSLHTIIAQAILDEKMCEVLRIMGRSHSRFKRFMLRLLKFFNTRDKVKQLLLVWKPFTRWKLQCVLVSKNWPLSKTLYIFVISWFLTRNWIGIEVPHKFPERSIPKLSKVNFESVPQLTNCVWQFMSQMMCSMFWGIALTFLSLDWTRLKHTHLIDHAEGKEICYCWVN